MYKAETEQLKAEANRVQVEAGMVKAKKKKAKATFGIVPSDGRILQAQTRIIKAIL